jgi:hypothetical protein
MRLLFGWSEEGDTKDVNGVEGFGYGIWSDLESRDI